MARIRSIKPEFPQSETIGKLSRDARLLFVQLWTIVDDAGRARAASRMLASLLYPYDDDAPSLIEGWLGELEREDCIRRYEVGGSRYLEITNWLKHQKIDKPSGSKMPSFDEGSPIPREDSRKLAPDLGPRTRDLGKDLGEGSSEPKGSGALAPPKLASPKDRVWDKAPELAIRSKKAESTVRSFLGKCFAEFDADVVERAVTAAIDEGSGDPCALITRILKPANGSGKARASPYANPNDHFDADAFREEMRRKDEQRIQAGLQ